MCLQSPSHLLQFSILVLSLPLPKRHIPDVGKSAKTLYRVAAYLVHQLMLPNTSEQRIFICIRMSLAYMSSSVNCMLAPLPSYHPNTAKENSALCQTDLNLCRSLTTSTWTLLPSGGRRRLGADRIRRVHGTWEWPGAN